jgi:probable HAF family extracellular repeat protein
MNLLDWLRNYSCQLGPKGDAERRAPDCQRLNVERLEDRCLLTSYSITDLGTFGGTLSYASGINNLGQVTGLAYIQCNCISHPFIWSDGILHDLGNGGQGLGINDLAQVVGYNGSTGHPFLWSRPAGMIDLPLSGIAHHINERAEVVGETFAPPHGFFWDDGQIVDVGAFSANGGSVAASISNRGEVVGQASGDTFTHAFVWTEAGGMQDLGSFDGTPGGTSGASAINDLGQIVSSSYSEAFGTTHAAYFTAHGVVDLGTLGGFSDAHALNNLGQVVGDSFGAFGDHEFLTNLDGGPMVDLNALLPADSGWSNLFTADGINDAGQIVGTGQLPGVNIIHAYLLTPDTSPGVIMGLGAAARAGAANDMPNDASCVSGRPGSHGEGRPPQNCACSTASSTTGQMGNTARAWPRNAAKVTSPSDWGPSTSPLELSQGVGT